MSRNQSVFTLVLVTLVVAGMVAAALRIAPPTELQVYRTLLKGLGPIHADTALMSRPTQCNANSLDSADTLNDLDKAFAGSATFSTSLYQSFLTANNAAAKPIQLGSLTDLIAVVDYDVSKSYQNSPGLLRSLNRQIVTLSRVGFDSSRREALLCLEGHFGSLYHFKYGQDGWELVGGVSTWFS